MLISDNSDNSTASVSDILKYLNNNNSMNVMDQNHQVARAKKRRLDHLTWEEKLQRKKLKNRVAAQTSRDRKKAKMDQMEKAIQELFSKNEALMAECENLKNINKRLQEENAELTSRLRLPCVTCHSQSWPVECEPASRSAASFLQLQGTGTDSAASLTKDNNRQMTLALWKIVLACLLYQTCLTNSTATAKSIPPALRNLQTAFCKISPKILKQLLRQQIVKNQEIIQSSHWWGKHQKSWNPVEETRTAVEVKC